MEIKSTKLWAAHWKALPMKTPPNNKANVNYGVDFCNLTSDHGEIWYPTSIMRDICNWYRGSWWDYGGEVGATLFKFRGKSTKAIEDWIVHLWFELMQEREMARIWPQISYSIHQGFFSSRILKSSQHFFQTASLGGGNLDQNNFVHPNQISYRIIRGGWISMWNLMAAVRTRRVTGDQAGINLFRQKDWSVQVLLSDVCYF